MDELKERIMKILDAKGRSNELKKRLLKIIDTDNLDEKILLIDLLPQEGFGNKVGRVNLLYEYAHELHRSLGKRQDYCSSEEEVMRRINDYIKKYWYFESGVKAP